MSNFVTIDNLLKKEDGDFNDVDCTKVTLSEDRTFKHVIWTPASKNPKFLYEEPVPAGVKEFANTGKGKSCPLFRSSPFDGEKAANPQHGGSGDSYNPEKFSVTIEDLLNFMAWCNGDYDDLKNCGYAITNETSETALKAMCETNKEVYELAKKDFFYPEFRHNKNNMTWYKFNNTFTCNYTRAYGKGVSLCFAENDFTAANIGTSGNTATCMVSYAYNSDPQELRDTLKGIAYWEKSEKLEKDGFFGQILNPKDYVFFCSFGNYQANR